LPCPSADAGVRASIAKAATRRTPRTEDMGGSPFDRRQVQSVKAGV
jgi:hypothetical protein